jgi:hypothetical protein
VAHAAAAAAVTAPATRPTVTPAVKHVAPVNLTGLWVLDKEASDLVAYEAALDLLALSGLQKMTARLIEALEVKQVRWAEGLVPKRTQGLVIMRMFVHLVLHFARMFPPSHAAAVAAQLVRLNLLMEVGFVGLG